MALAAVAVAVVTRLSFDPLLNDTVPFIPLFLAVGLGAWYGGRGAGVLALVAGAVATELFRFRPYNAIGIDQSEHQVGLALYGVFSLALIALLDSLRKSIQRAEDEQQRCEREVALHVATKLALAEQAERLRTTLASIGDAVLTTDTQTRITDMNVVAESLTGWTTAEAIGQPLDAVFRIVHETTRQTVVSPIHGALEHGVIVRLPHHTVLMARDGTERPIDDTAAPIRRADGEIVGSVLVFRDVSELHRQEAELREREREFRTLAESIPQLTWVANANGHVFWYNRRWYEYTGTTLQQTQGRRWRDVHEATALPALLSQWKACVDTGTPFDQTIRLKGSDGHYRPFLTRVEPVKNEAGHVIRWFGTSTDIGAQTRAERALRESNERYRAATAAVSDLIWTNTADGLMDDEQPGWQAFTGQSPEEYRGVGWSKAVHPDDAQPTLDAWTLAVAEKRTFVFEHRVRRGDGEWRLCSVRAVPIIHDGGKIREWVGVHTDVTERRRHEEALRELTAELSEADRRKDEFLSTLAHELRNPLAPIRNGLEVMKMAGGKDVTIERTRRMMERQLTQMVRLVDDLMDVGRISHGKLEVRKEQVSLVEVLNNAVESTRPLIDQLGQTLTVTVPKQPLVVDADLTRLAQVFVNLLNNAAKYGKRGGHIALDVEQHGNDVAVRVKDTGIGIAADQLPHIFDLFTQVDRSSEKSQGGLGIGLTLVKRLVELHGGAVEARSEGPGKGSEFVVQLPVVFEAPRPYESGGEQHRRANALLRILIVDDNRDAAESLAMMLRIIGHDTRTAYDGQAGVDEARTFRPDVIVFDIGMPKLNGYEACRLIREQSWGGSIVLIALTGLGKELDRRRSHDAGFNHHLVKPVEPQALVKMLAGFEVAKR
ncbi:PAS domain S-box protein [Gemmatimonas sp.]|uniref:PAS domain S-box protein n=1 Tax=Gemmatimonas sp. TaxID=1962908 RepID=UPI0039836659